MVLGLGLEGAGLRINFVISTVDGGNPAPLRTQKILRLLGGSIGYIAWCKISSMLVISYQCRLK